MKFSSLVSLAVCLVGSTAYGQSYSYEKENMKHGGVIQAIERLANAVENLSGRVDRLERGGYSPSSYGGGYGGFQQTGYQQPASYPSMGQGEPMFGQPFIVIPIQMQMPYQQRMGALSFNPNYYVGY